MALTDENAFGLLVQLYDIEELEYGAESEDFAARFVQFRTLVLEHAATHPLGEGAIALELGHAVYFEIGDGDQGSDPIAWLRGLCAPLVQDGFELAAVVSHGGRWVDGDAPAPPEVLPLDGGYRAVRFGYPSEPLQRALRAAAFCHGSDGEDGWGAGLFVDTEAVEALGKQLRNAPTPLSAGSATFYRLGLPR
jgi:hypothetical protein